MTALQVHNCRLFLNKGCSSAAAGARLTVAYEEFLVLTSLTWFSSLTTGKESTIIRLQNPFQRYRRNKLVGVCVCVCVLTGKRTLLAVEELTLNIACSRRTDFEHCLQQKN